MELENVKSARSRGRPLSFDRETALEKAMELFWRLGYEATSISALTAAMGINPPSLYTAFGDKEKLYLEAVQRYQDGPGNVGLVLMHGATARASVSALLDANASELVNAAHPPGCMVVGAALGGGSASDSLQADMRQRRCMVEAAVRARIERGLTEGDVAAGTDAAALAKYYMTVIQGMTVQARDGATQPQLQLVADMALRSWPG